MERKQRPHERAGSRSYREADLGQKEAALEKASKEELEHMGNAKAAAAAREQKPKQRST
jgi:hypothetical protein